jgi:hypothetical protein
MTLSIVDHGTLSIDSYLPYEDTQDKAFFAGHYYSDKVPGLTVWLVPFAWDLRHILPRTPDPEAMIIALRYFGLALPMVAFWWLACAELERVTGSRRTALALVLAGALGTNFFIYAFRKGYQSGLGGIQAPDLGSLLGMWFSRRRGLVFLSPFLLLSPFGLHRLWRERSFRSDALLATAVIASMALFTSTTLDWTGGWGTGVRYMVPALPFFASRLRHQPWPPERIVRIGRNPT